MRVDEYKVLSEAVEIGVTRGINRAYKHVDVGEHPSDVTLRDCLFIAVLGEILEYFKLEDQYDEEELL